MSNANKSELQTDDIQEDTVADYLQAHPDFFERHQSLLTDLRVPHRPGTAVSLVERQVATLRQKNLLLETNLRDLVAVARSNDELTDKIHALATRLLAAGSRSQAIDIAEELLRSSFNADQSVLVLFETDTVGEFSRFGGNDNRFLHFPGYGRTAMRQNS